MWQWVFGGSKNLGKKCRGILGWLCGAKWRKWGEEKNGGQCVLEVRKGKKKKIGREKLGRWATSGVRWKWVDPKKNGEEEKSRWGLDRVGVRRESGKRKKMKRGMGR